MRKLPEDGGIHPEGMMPVSRQLPESGPGGEYQGECRRNPMPSNSSEPTAGAAPGIEEGQVVTQVFMTRNRVTEFEAGPCIEVLPRPRHSV